MPNQISSIGNDQFFDSNGNLLVGGKLFTYLAGTSTKVATYTNILGSGSHTNPIVLNSSGIPPSPIYITIGVPYKFVLAPASDTDPPSSPIYTWDDILIPENPDPVQWVDDDDVPTYISATQFSVPTDRTAIYHVGRRVQLISNSGTFYGWITASTYTSVTTVTVVLDSGILDATLHTVYYSFLVASGSGVPNTRHSSLDTTFARDVTALRDIFATGEFVGVGAAPPGGIIAYGGSSAPSGWLLCDGAAVSRTTYARLFAAISTAYGVGDGSTTFNLPDLRGRVPIGVDGSANRITSASTNGANADTLGGVGGAETHTLVTGEIPAHTHTVPAYATAGAILRIAYIPDGDTLQVNETTSSTGGGGAHSNTQPWQTVNYIIRI